MKQKVLFAHSLGELRNKQYAVSVFEMGARMVINVCRRGRRLGNDRFLFGLALPLPEPKRKR